MTGAGRARGAAAAAADATLTHFSTGTLRGLGEKATLHDIYAHLRAVYCGTVGAEFMNIDDIDQKRWVAERLETLPGREVLNRAEELHVLRKLADAENFERLLHNRFPGTKRFSVGRKTPIHVSVTGTRPLSGDQ